MSLVFAANFIMFIRQRVKINANATDGINIMNNKSTTATIILAFKLYLQKILSLNTLKS